MHTLIKSTNPNYSSGSGLMLEVKFPGDENWSKLKSAEPYLRNQPQSVQAQIHSLEQYRDKWMSNGPTKYFNAKYRIGEYRPEGREYAWYDASLLVER